MGWGEMLVSAGGLVVLAVGLAEIGQRLRDGINELFERRWPIKPEDSWADFDVATADRSRHEAEQLDRLREAGL